MGRNTVIAVIFVLFLVAIVLGGWLYARWYLAMKRRRFDTAHQARVAAQAAAAADTAGAP